MSHPDRHRTRRISRIAAALTALFFLVVGVVGYQRTGEAALLLLFLVLALVGFGVVRLLFHGVDRVLDSLDRRQP